MPIPRPKSLRARLFIFASVLIASSVALVSWRNVRMFRQILDRQLEDAVTLKAKETANTLSGTLNSWLGVLALATQDSAQTQNSAKSVATNLVNSHSDIVAMELFEQGPPEKPLGHAFTENGADVRFDDKQPSAVRAALFGLGKDAALTLARAHPNAPVQLLDAQRMTGLPLLMLVVRFKANDGKASYISLLTVWQTPLLAALPDAADLHGLVVDAKLSQVLTATHHTASLNLDRSLLGLIRGMRAAQGFHSYKDGTGRAMLGAFHKVPGFDLTVVTTQDAGRSYDAINLLIIKSTLAGWLVLLVGILASYVSSERITKALASVIGATERIAKGDFTPALQPGSDDEVGRLSGAVNTMATQIKGLLERRVDEVRKENELATARLVQATLFPRKTPTALQLATITQPASECCGDWWGHYCRPNGRELLVIADATGHGVPAALVTALAYSACQTLLGPTAADTDDSPARIIETLNRLLYETGEGNTTMTCFVAMFDPATRSLACCNAGHNMPLRMWRTDKGTFDIRSLQVRGDPLGFAPTSRYESKTMQLNPGEKLIFFTDGVFECRNADGRDWGMRRFRDTLTRMGAESPETIKDAVFSEGRAHLAGATYDDDATLLVVEIPATWGTVATAEAS
jgi:serine phosphatase RsbU (regulator of sigma subunit)